MNFDQQRKMNKDKSRIAIVKARLRNYREDLLLADALLVRVGVNRDKLSLQSGWSSADPVQGGGSSQEDKLTVMLDKIADDERNLKMIELENRVLAKAISDLPDEDLSFIVWHKWVYDDMSMDQLARELKLSKTTAWRKSDEALLFIYERLYLVAGDDVDVR